MGENRLEKFRQKKFKNHYSNLDFSNAGICEEEHLSVSKARKNKRITIDEYKTLLKKNKWTQKDFGRNGYSVSQIAFFNWLLKGKCNLSKEDFVREYIDKMTELNDISVRYGINRGYLTFLREHYNIKRQGHKRRVRLKECGEITEKQWQVIYGSLLGDAKIDSGKVFSVRHSVKQIEYCKWKLKLLSSHSNYEDPRIDKDYDERFDSFNETCFFSTLSHHSIEDLCKRIYADGVKTVSKWWLNKLSDFGLAVWFMDDGCTDFCHRSDYNVSPQCKIYTCSFGEEGSEIAADWFLDRYGIRPSIQYKSEGNVNPYLYFNAEDSQKLIDIISPHIIDCMKYKVDSGTSLEKYMIHKKSSESIFHLPTKSRFKRLDNAEQSRVVEEVFQHYRESGFPYYEFNLDQIRLQFSKLKNLQSKHLLSDEWVIKPNYRCCNLIQFYQPHMFNMAAKGCLTPLEIFSDDDMFRDAIRRRLAYAGPCTESGIRQILKTYKSNRGVSNFAPAVAKCIYDDLLKSGGNVLDFCAGFGGRLLGAAASEKVGRYCCIDVMKKNCIGLEKMKNDIVVDTRVKIINNLAESAVEYESSDYDMVFTSPPYFDNEIYGEGKGQSIRKHPEYEDWLLNWLMPIIRRSFKLLRNGGFLVLSLGKSHSGHDITSDVKGLLSYDYNIFREYKMQTGTSEYHRKKSAKKYHPIIVYRV